MTYRQFVKSISTLVLIVFSFSLTFAQYFCPPELIVNATGLRLRSAPNIGSEIITKLDNGEYLDFLEFPKNDDPSFKYYENLFSTWIKVTRQQTGEVGYVHGKYVQSSSLAYTQNQGCSKIPDLNWVGIKLDNEKAFVKNIYPAITKDKFNTIIADPAFSYFLLGTKNKIEEGEINGSVFHNERVFTIVANEHKLVETVNGLKTHLYVCRDFDAINNARVNIVERLYISITDEKDNQLLYQELTQQYNHTIADAFRVNFLGDINKDGMPDLIISTLSDTGPRFFWFLSKSGKLDLQSITTYSIGC